MIKGYYERIARFLSSIARGPDGSPIRPDPGVISAVIAELIRRGWTREQLLRQALEAEDVIIREDLFPREVQR